MAINWITDLEIDSSDRIENLTAPVDDDDSTEMNARWIMRMLDKIIDGQYRLRVPRYRTSTRPSPAYKGEIIINEDTDTLEVYDGSKWQSMGV